MRFGNLRRYTAGTPERFATRRCEEDLKQVAPHFPIAEAREWGRYAFLPQRLGKGDATLSYRCGELAALRHGPSSLALRTRAGATRPAAMRCAAPLHEPSAFAFDLRAPCAAVRGGRKGPQGNRHGCRFLFARAGSPVEKPGRPTRTGRLRRPAPSGGAFSLGYFSLGKQRKVTRPPVGGRNAHRVGGQADATLRPSDTTTGSRPLPPFVGRAGVTVQMKRCSEHPPLTPTLSP
ncbi:hypothetical protein DyAD56_10145 [Dyella sp. AD56]|nr:hypothetical protein DyAD56_10145 [Dyella sp. AD56]